jgi:hypothetical protein
MKMIERFYEIIKRGTSVQEFMDGYAALFPYIRSSGLLEDYRLGRGRLKRLRDEVTPAARFVRQHAAPKDRIQLPLDYGITDCNVWHHAPTRHRTIQITLIQGRERLNLMTELNETGWGRGFLGVTDDRPTSEFLDAIGKERQMYSTEQSQTTLAHAVTLCAQNKSNSQGDTLLIEAPIYLPMVRMLEIQSQLSQLVSRLSFSEVYLLGDDYENGDLCLQLK